MDLSLLPDEILPNIFKYLPLEDRKNVRLSCQLWNFACNRPEIIANEKFVFRMGIEDEGDTFRLAIWLMDCKTPRPHFEFQVLPLMELTADVWSRCGHEIESLVLFDCDVSNATIMSIIIYCDNLKYLRIRSPRMDPMMLFCDTDAEVDYNDFNRRYKPFCSEKIFDKLIKEQVVRRELITLELLIGYPISNEMYEKIFQVFPCIRNLGQGYDSMSNATFYNDENIFVKHTNPAHKWALPPMVENFTAIAADISESWIFPMLKFKGFSTMIDLEQNFNWDPIVHFFSHQTELEKLELFIFNGSHNEAKDLLLEVLNSTSTNLKALKFTSFCEGECEAFSPLCFSMEEFRDFLLRTCELESLTLSCPCGVFLDEDDDDDDVEEPFPIDELPKKKYVNLKTLRIGGSTTDARISLEILNRCGSSLQSLCLKSVNDDVLQKIFDTFTELRTLRIEGVFKCSELGFNRNKELDDANSNGHSAYDSFRRLPHLQHLEMKSVPASLIETSLSEFDFPNLRYFSLTFKWMRDSPGDEKLLHLTEERCYGADVLRELLDVLSTRSPRLEVLRFCSSFLSAAELVHYCQKWKNLRFLGIDGMIVTKKAWRKRFPFPGFEVVFGPQLFDEDLDEVKDLFVKCPSLLYVNNFLFHGAYFYDRSSQKLKRYKRFEAFYHKHNVAFDL